MKEDNNLEFIGIDWYGWRNIEPCILEEFPHLSPVKYEDIKLLFKYTMAIKGMDGMFNPDKSFYLYNKVYKEFDKNTLVMFDIIYGRWMHYYFDITRENMIKRFGNIFTK